MASARTPAMNWRATPAARNDRPEVKIYRRGESRHPWAERAILQVMHLIEEADRQLEEALSRRPGRCQCAPDCPAATSGTYARGHWDHSRLARK